MHDLETIVHPFVFQAVDIIIRRATQPVIVVEAVKLLETELKSWVNSIWVVTSPRDTQVARLVTLRKLSLEDATERINAQNTQAEKVTQANVIITNNGPFEDSWKQVYDAWKKIALPTSVMTEPVVSLPKGKMMAGAELPVIMNGYYPWSTAWTQQVINNLKLNSYIPSLIMHSCCWKLKSNW